HAEGPRIVSGIGEDPAEYLSDFLLAFEPGRAAKIEQRQLCREVFVHAHAGLHVSKPFARKSPALGEPLRVPNLRPRTKARAQLRGRLSEDRRELVGPSRAMPQVEGDRVRSRRPPTE